MNEEIHAPTPIGLLGEARGFLELPRLLLQSSRLARQPKGRGQPVLVLPGFGAGDASTGLRGEHPTDASKSMRGRIRGDRDPGYGSTSKMLGESAVCLAKDAIAVAGGCWTPASAMGEPLLARLDQNAGVTFRIEA